MAKEMKLSAFGFVGFLCLFVCGLLFLNGQHLLNTEYVPAIHTVVTVTTTSDSCTLCKNKTQIKLQTYF